jgi:hypothetical protein
VIRRPNALFTEGSAFSGVILRMIRRVIRQQPGRESRPRTDPVHDAVCQITGDLPYDDSEAVRLENAKNPTLRPARPTLPKNVKPGAYDASAATPTSVHHSSG